MAHATASAPLPDLPQCSSSPAASTEEAAGAAPPPSPATTSSSSLTEQTQVSSSSSRATATTPPKDQKEGAAAGDGEEEKSGVDQESAYFPEEEVTEGNWRTPQVEVSLVKVATGEEEEKCIWQQRSKLYRWDQEAGAWKERGVGEAKLLQHKATEKIRFLLRQEKTLKIVANHYVYRRKCYCRLTANVGSDKIWVWTVPDSAEEKQLKVEQFGLKFGQLEQAKIFKEKFEEAAEWNSKLFKEVDCSDDEETPPAPTTSA